MALYLDLGSYHITKSIESFSLPALRYGRNTQGFPSPLDILAADLGKSVNVIVIPQLLCRHTHVISVTRHSYLHCLCVSPLLKELAGMTTKQRSTLELV